MHGKVEQCSDSKLAVTVSSGELLNAGPYLDLLSLYSGLGWRFCILGSFVREPDKKPSLRTPDRDGHGEKDRGALDRSCISVCNQLCDFF